MQLLNNPAPLSLCRLRDKDWSALPKESKDAQLQRAVKLRTELRRTIAEVEVLLRKAEDLLWRNRRASGSGEKKLFDGWRSRPPEDES